MQMKTINGKLTISRLHSSDKDRNHAIIITIEDENFQRVKDERKEIDE